MTALEFDGLVWHVAELNIEEIVLYVPCWHLLCDPRAHSFLPLILIGISLFLDILWCLLLSSCGKSGLFRFVYSWMLTPMKMIQYFLHKYKYKHLAVKYLWRVHFLGHGAFTLSAFLDSTKLFPKEIALTGLSPTPHSCYYFCPSFILLMPFICFSSARKRCFILFHTLSFLRPWFSGISFSCLMVTQDLSSTPFLLKCSVVCWALFFPPCLWHACILWILTPCPRGSAASIFL